MHWMGGNKPLRGLLWWEWGASSGMKYKARWSRPFIILYWGATQERAAPTRGIVRTTWRMGRRRWEHVCMHFYTKALAEELCACQAHMARCVFMNVYVSGVRESEGGWKIRWRSRDRGGRRKKRGACKHLIWWSWWCLCVCFKRCSVIPAVVQKMRGQHGDEDVLPVHGQEQSSRAVDTCS